jgi:hypothetical protein
MEGSAGTATATTPTAIPKRCSVQSGTLRAKTLSSTRCGAVRIGTWLAKNATACGRLSENGSAPNSTLRLYGNINNRQTKVKGTYNT